jgi:hypothetical protein
MVRVAPPPIGVAAEIEGADVSVYESRTDEYGERPEAFTAATWNSYWVPAVSPDADIASAVEGE